MLHKADFMVSQERSNEPLGSTPPVGKLRDWLATISVSRITLRDEMGYLLKASEQ
jgi:hypothetical protein